MSRPGYHGGTFIAPIGDAPAAARGIGTSTLMRQIIQEWVDQQGDQPAPDHVSELVRHLDAARRAAGHLATWPPRRPEVE